MKKYIVSRVFYPVCLASSRLLGRCMSFSGNSRLLDSYLSFLKRVLSCRARVATVPARCPDLRWTTYWNGLDFYTMHDETCNDVVELNNNGLRWRASHLAQPYAIHAQEGEQTLSYSVSSVKDGLRFTADDKLEHWIYLVGKEELPSAYALDFDYIPHSVFNEQLQVDFAAESLAKRHRFILEFCRTAFYQTVECGMFLQKMPRVHYDVPLHQSLHVRVEVVQNVFCLALNDEVVLCVKDRFYKPRNDRSFLLFWNGLGGGGGLPVD